MIRLIFIAAIAALFLFCHWNPSVNPVATPVSVVINEFMANNDSGFIRDENKQADDWVELYNMGKNPASLKGLFLSDDSTKLNKFVLPDTMLPSRGFILIWADNDEKQGRMHASFKLSRKNGEIILTEGEKTVLDRIHYDSSDVTSKTSYGRWTDGALTWAQQLQPTPGSENSGGIIDEQ